MKQVLALFLASTLAGPVFAQDTETASAVPISEDSIAEDVVSENATAEDVTATPPVETLSPIGPLKAADVNLADLQWVKRPIVVFADTEADPRFQDQIALLLERAQELEERDIVIITDTDPAGASDIRIKLRPRGFQLTLIGKDGAVKLRKPLPWDVREISRVIDKMPMRRQEIRDRSLGN